MLATIPYTRRRPIPDWITTEEASLISGYHVEHLRLLLRNNRIHGLKFGRSWMVDRASLMGYLDKIKQRGERRGRKPKSHA
jgi:excisionase family DNA binding protein